MEKLAAHLLDQQGQTVETTGVQVAGADKSLDIHGKDDGRYDRA